LALKKALDCTYNLFIYELILEGEMKSGSKNEYSKLSFFFLLLLLTTIDIAAFLILKLDIPYWLVGLPILILFNAFIAVIFSASLGNLISKLPSRPLAVRQGIILLAALFGTFLGWGLCLVCLIIAKALGGIVSIFFLVESISTMPVLGYMFSVIALRVAGLESKSAAKALLAGYIPTALVICILAIVFREGFKDLQKLVLISSIVNAVCIPLASLRMGKMFQKGDIHRGWDLLLDFFNFLK